MTALSHMVQDGPITSGDQSVAQHLRRSAREIRRRTTRDLRLPGYDNLHVVFRALTDYKEVKAEVKRVFGNRQMPDDERDIQLAIVTLLMSSIDSYAIVDDVKHEIGLPLGLELYDFIWPPENEDEARPETDAEALILLFDSNTVQITSMANDLDLWFKDTSRKTDEELLGN